MSAEIGTTVSNTIKLLKLYNPDRTYATSLVTRTHAKFKKQVFGDDGLKKMRAFGDRIIEEGGIFKFDTDDDLRITGIYIQTKEMKKYQEVYGDYSVIDGSHDMVKHGDLKFIPMTGVCGLGKSCVKGYALCPEAIEFLVSMSKKINIPSVPVLMSDQGQAFCNYASFLDAIPLLCSWHYKE